MLQQTLEYLEINTNNVLPVSSLAKTIMFPTLHMQLMQQAEQKQ